MATTSSFAAISCRCPNPECGKYIHSCNPNRPTCDLCGFQFCLNCKKQNHGVSDCKSKFPLPQIHKRLVEARSRLEIDNAPLLSLSPQNVVGMNAMLSCHCPNPECGKFIQVDVDLPWCFLCKFGFCFHCRRAFHGTTECKVRTSIAMRELRLPSTFPLSPTALLATMPSAPPACLLEEDDNREDNANACPGTVNSTGDPELQCAICMDRKIDTAFTNCGHTCCARCALTLKFCHICRSSIWHQIKIFL